MNRAANPRSLLTTALLGCLMLAIPACQMPSHGRRARRDAEQRWRLSQADVKARLAADRLAAGDIRQASEEIAEARRLAPDNPGLKLLEARTLLAAGRFARARGVLNAITGPTRRGGEVAYLLGVIAQQRNDWDAALDQYLTAARQKPDVPEYVVAAAEVQLQLGRPTEALELLDSCKRRLGFQPAWLAARAECLEQLDRWDEAADTWQRVAGTSDAEHVSERLALALMRAGDWNRATPLLRRLVQAAGPDEALPLRLALAECLLETGDRDGARRQILSVLEAKPRNLPALRLLARVLAAAGHYRRGLNVATQILDIAPDDTQGLELAAALAYKIGEYDRAARWSRRLACADPHTPNPIASRILARRAAK